jgi:hypothetical protein
MVGFVDLGGIMDSVLPGNGQVVVNPDSRVYQDLLDGGFLTPNGHGLRVRKIETAHLDTSLCLGEKPHYANLVLRLRGVDRGPWRHIKLTKKQLQELLNKGAEILRADADGHICVDRRAIFLKIPTG